MPELRLEKTRATLPSGYQFGDARDVEVLRLLDIFPGRREFAIIGAMQLDRLRCPICVSIAE